MESMPTTSLPTKDGSTFRFSRKPHMRENGATLELYATLKASLDEPIALEDFAFYLGDILCTSKIEADYSLADKRKTHSCKIIASVLKEAIYDLPIHSDFCVCLTNESGESQSYRIMYSKSLLSHVMRYTAAHTKFFHDNETDMVAFFRQSRALHVVFTVRPLNVTDAASQKVKLFCAFVLSKIAFWMHPLLMYEKNGRHYEESGRVVYEQLIDQGYKNIRFILNQSVQDQADLDPAYRAHMVRQFSFSHYLMFFRCKTFMGTEVLDHALELRCQNLFVQRKLRSTHNTHVFLQHGVMYMVPMDAPERSFFQRKSMRAQVHIVVSSKKEANQFVVRGGFNLSDTILCGLPKFDRSYLNDGADKIFIMPSWRIWEFNEMRYEPSRTGYVRLIERIVEAIPEQLRDKIVIAYHPLFEASTFLTQYSQNNPNYDVLLRDVALLITDYSSIAYDSFYRGSNVIFYGEEYDECMRHYGEDTKLVLTEDEAFGPMCFDAPSLSNAIERLYGKPQDELYQQRFKQLVEFHDGKNTERLIQELQNRGVLSPEPSK